MTVPLISSMLAELQRRRKAFCKPLAGLLLVAILAFPGYSQTVGNWTFSNILSGTGSAYNTVGNISLGSAIPSNAFNGGTEWFGENGWPAGALNTNAYIQFTITPNTSYELNLTDIVLRIRRSNTGSPAGSGPTQWSLRSSLDGFASDIISSSLTHNYANYSVPLNSSFHHLYTTITFRLYGYNATVGSGGMSRFVVDNITVNGLISVLPLTFSGTHIARTANNNNLVQWQVNNIEAGTRFSLQRSTDGIAYTSIYSITEAESHSQKQFSYTDVFKSQRLFYRVEVTEPSGNTFFSPVMRSAGQAVANPSLNYLSVSGQSLVATIQVDKENDYTLLVYTPNGVLIQKRLVHLQPGINSISIPLTNSSHGLLTVCLYNQKQLSNKKVIY